MSNPSPVATEDQPRFSIDRLVVRAAIIDLAVGLALVAVAAVFWFAAADFDEADSTGIGAATFPRGIAVLLGVAAAMLAARAILSLCGRLPSVTSVISRPGHVLAGMGLVILFPVLMSNLGYYIGSALWMPALFVVAGYRKPLGIVILTAGFLVFAKVGFEMILGVRLP
jgi:Tripartite tricarboxylate transporter TctB family